MRLKSRLPWQHVTVRSRRTPRDTFQSTPWPDTNSFCQTQQHIMQRHEDKKAATKQTNKKWTSGKKSHQFQRVENWKYSCTQFKVCLLCLGKQL